MKQPWTVRPWARAFIADEPEPKNVTPPSQRSDHRAMREALETRRQSLEQKLLVCRKVNRMSLGQTAGLFVVSQLPMLPSWVHWTAFLAAIVTGAIAFTSWWDVVTFRKLVELTSADLLTE